MTIGQALELAARVALAGVAMIAAGAAFGALVGRFWPRRKAR